jgi:hypothetical protein
MILGPTRRNNHPYLPQRIQACQGRSALSAKQRMHQIMPGRLPYSMSAEAVQLPDLGGSTCTLKSSKLRPQEFRLLTGPRAGIPTPVVKFRHSRDGPAPAIISPKD